MTRAEIALAKATRDDLASGRARNRRELAGARQGDVAAALGVTRQAVSKWESGQSVPSAAHALEYGKLLRQLAKRAA